jgi:beta-1,4-mannooligosaccharide/beta-1,4-mannosyl-N-acetylglucosamine phosphorylase
VRNGVLFPEKVGGRYLLLERPNTVQPEGGARTGDVIELLSSDDLLRWTSEGPVLAGRRHYWDELIGAGPPPVKTTDGWLLIYHGVATHLNDFIYQAGAALLDLADPTLVRGRTRDNLLEPRELYELTGQVPNVVFPSGLVCDPPREDGTLTPDGTVRVIYGAADTCVGLASATVRELVEACDGA